MNANILVRLIIKRVNENQSLFSAPVSIGYDGSKFVRRNKNEDNIHDPYATANKS